MVSFQPAAPAPILVQHFQLSLFAYPFAPSFYFPPLPDMISLRDCNAAVRFVPGVYSIAAMSLGHHQLHCSSLHFSFYHPNTRNFQLLYCPLHLCSSALLSTHLLHCHGHGTHRLEPSSSMALDVGGPLFGQPSAAATVSDPCMGYVTCPMLHGQQ